MRLQQISCSDKSKQLKLKASWITRLSTGLTRFYFRNLYILTGLLVFSKRLPPRCSLSMFALLFLFFLYYILLFYISLSVLNWSSWNLAQVLNLLTHIAYKLFLCNRLCCFYLTSCRLDAIKITVCQVCVSWRNNSNHHPSSFSSS